jgi:nitrogen fixation NifU-like protein
MNPDNVSIIQTYEGPCGDTMQFFLKIENDIIQDISFITDGCGASVATGSQATILIKGQHIDFAENLTAEEIDNALHSLPEDHKHCAELAARTLRKAIEQYKNKII